MEHHRNLFHKLSKKWWYSLVETLQLPFPLLICVSSSLHRPSRPRLYQRLCTEVLAGMSLPSFSLPSLMSSFPTNSCTREDNPLPPLLFFLYYPLRYLFSLLPPRQGPTPLDSLENTQKIQIKKNTYIFPATTKKRRPPRYTFIPRPSCDTPRTFILGNPR